MQSLTIFILLAYASSPAAGHCESDRAKFQPGACKKIVLPSTKVSLEFPSASFLECLMRCQQSPLCNGVAFSSVSKNCSFTRHVINDSDCYLLPKSPGVRFQEKYCYNGGTQLANMTCSCVSDFVGSRCQVSIKDLNKKVCLSTPGYYVYETVLDYENYPSWPRQVNINATACSDVHIGLFANKYDDRNNFYEIVLGGWGNNRCVLRDSAQSMFYLAEHYGNVVSCLYPTSFTVEWTVQYVRVLWYSFQVFYHAQPVVPARYVAVSTNAGVIGAWTLGVESGVKVESGFNFCA